MKRMVVVATTLGVLVGFAMTTTLPTAAAADETGPVISLFDGESLEGWKGQLEDPAVPEEEVWSVDEGVLVCQGEPFGYLESEKSFKNFVLTLQWRWAPGKEPGNSGVLLRIDGPPVGFMPKCVEAQLHTGNAGDVWAFRGATVSGPEDRLREVKDHDALGDFTGVGKIEANENPPGEWNTYVIVAYEDTITIFVNGKKVNEVAGCEVSSGPIGLQSEGAEIHFRNISLIPLAN